MSNIDGGAVGIAAAVRGGRLSAVEVAEAALARIAARDPALNSFTAVTEARALADARAVDALLARGEDPGLLAGVPFAVKNLFDVKGLVTIAGSRIDRERAPATADATVIQRLAGAGAILVGALNMDEYAYGFTTENTHYGPAHNPHDLARVAGGSSGGSGAAVAGRSRAVGARLRHQRFDPGAGLALRHLRAEADLRPPEQSRRAALRRQPRPCRPARRARSPISPPPTMRCRAPTRATRPAPTARSSRRLPELERGAEGLRIAVAGGYFAGTGAAAAAVARVAQALGVARTVEIPEAARARAAAFVITASEGANLHFADLKARAGDFDPMTRDRFLAGALVPATWVIEAQRFRRWYRDQLLALFDDTDILLMPATPCSAPLIGQDTIEIDGAQVPSRPYLGVYTQPLSFIGLPIVAVPLRAAGALPIGVQIVAAPWRESDALRVARTLERDGVTCERPPRVIGY